MPRARSATLGLVCCVLGATAFGYFAGQGLLAGRVRPLLGSGGKVEVTRAAEPLRYWIAISTYAAAATIFTLYGRRLLAPPVDSAKPPRRRSRK